MRSIKSRRLVVNCDSSSLVYVLCNGKIGRRRSANLVRNIKENCADREVWFKWINGRKNPADALLKERRDQVLGTQKYLQLGTTNSVTS